MTAIAILSVLLLAAALLPLTPVRLGVCYDKGVFTVTGKAGPVPVRLFPRERVQTAERDADKDARKLTERVSPQVLRMLAACAFQAAARLLRRARIEVLRVRYTAAGPDPARAVMAYARAGIAMEAIAGLVDCADLRADVDLEGGRSAFAGRIGIYLRLGTVLAAAFCFGIAFLRKYYQYKRERE